MAIASHSLVNEAKWMVNEVTEILTEVGFYAGDEVRNIVGTDGKRFIVVVVNPCPLFVGSFDVQHIYDMAAMDAYKQFRWQYAFNRSNVGRDDYRGRPVYKMNQAIIVPGFDVDDVGGVYIYVIVFVKYADRL